MRIFARFNIKPAMSANEICDEHTNRVPNKTCFVVSACYTVSALVAVLNVFLVYMLVIAPVNEWNDNSVEVLCKINETVVYSYPGLYLTLFAMDMSVNYTFANTPYKAIIYFAQGHATDPSVFTVYTPGTVHNCYVDPKSPTDIALVRKYHDANLLSLLFTVVALWFCLQPWVMLLIQMGIKKHCLNEIAVHNKPA